ncbi:MAG: molybdopterin converting factor subunit 1 [Bacteroidota bacterium]
MRIQILSFGIAKDIIGGSTTEIEIPDDQNTVGHLKSKIIDQYPRFEDLRSLKIAVNNEYAQDEQSISAEDEIVIIPPVSGG